jgi:hypothetical protein
MSKERDARRGRCEQKAMQRAAMRETEGCEGCDAKQRAEMRRERGLRCETEGCDKAATRNRGLRCAKREMHKERVEVRKRDTQRESGGDRRTLMPHRTEP